MKGDGWKCPPGGRFRVMPVLFTVPNEAYDTALTARSQGDRA